MENSRNWNISAFSISSKCTKISVWHVDHQFPLIWSISWQISLEYFLFPISYARRGSSTRVFKNENILEPKRFTYFETTRLRWSKPFFSNRSFSFLLSVLKILINFLKCRFHTPTQSFLYQTPVVLVKFLVHIFWAFCQKACKAWAREINRR